MENFGDYSGEERRKFQRLDIDFVVSYKVKPKSELCDLSQTKNVSQGGMLLTTNCQFEAGTFLDMIIKVPFVKQKIEVVGRVVVSKEVARDLLYETRIEFIGLDEEAFRQLGDFVTEN